jgi:hypothetical protein
MHREMLKLTIIEISYKKKKHSCNHAPMQNDRRYEQKEKEAFVLEFTDAR